MTKFGWYAIGTSTTLESNKSQGRILLANLDEQAIFLGTPPVPGSGAAVCGIIGVCSLSIRGSSHLVAKTPSGTGGIHGHHTPAL